MKKHYLFAFIILLAFIASCKKDTSIGADILPPDDLLNLRFSDTFSLNVKTLEDTFLRTDKLAKNYLGIINDAQFGFQKASIVLELDRPNSVLDDTLGPFTLDSVVMLMKYNYVYGDSTIPQNFSVSTISNPINENLAYYSNSTAFPAASNIGNESNYYFRPSNRVIMSATDTVGSTGIFRVSLNNSFGNAIIGSGQTILRDSTLFKSAFPGIRIENSTTTGNCMAELDLNSSASAVVVYYKDKYSKKREMRLFASIYKNVNGSIVARPNSINLFSNTKTSAIQNVINSGVISDSVNYILGQGGTTIHLMLPTILNNGIVAVNRAEILATQIIPNSDDELTAPLFLFLLKKNASGSLEVLPTQEGLGIVDSTGRDALGNKFVRYKISISKYIQNITKGTESNSDMFLVTYRGAGSDGSKNNLNTIINGNTINLGYTPSRVVVAGPNYSNQALKMKFNFTYTLIE